MKKIAKKQKREMKRKLLGLSEKDQESQDESNADDSEDSQKAFERSPGYAMMSVAQKRAYTVKRREEIEEKMKFQQKWDKLLSENIVNNSPEMKVIHFNFQDSQSLGQDQIPPTLLSWKKIEILKEQEREAKLALLEA